MGESKGGGWRGGAGDQVIRIINLDSSCLGAGDPKTSRGQVRTRERRLLSPAGTETRLELYPGAPNCGSTGSPPLPRSPSRPSRPLSPGRNLGASRAVPAASFRARGARDLEATRLEPQRALSATRAALAAAGGKAHASGEAQGPRAAAAARLGKS